MRISAKAKALYAILLLGVLQLNVSAQDFAERIKADPGIACGVYHPYIHGDMSDTPAPKGYKPFYVSHFGRHGSRYHTTESYFKAAMEGLSKADEMGILNETGKQLYADVQTLLKAHNGMEGELSPLGGREHKAIAARMYARFPEAFNSRTRTEVECVASTITRCIISMANFSESLSSCRPELDFTFFTGKKYFEYIMKEGPYRKEISAGCKAFSDSLRTAICRHDKMYSSIFTDLEKAGEAVKNPQSFMYSLYMAGAICLDLDFLGLDIFKYFDNEELVQQAKVRSGKMYAEYGNSAEWGEKSSIAADDLLKDFIAKADAAMKDESRRAADLRFGHDTGILPLMGLIGIKEMSERIPSDGSWEYWTSCDRIPMASNFQMVFFRNRKGEVLVKMLYNEQETTIPALTPTTGPYYSWETLRSYLQSKVSD